METQWFLIEGINPEPWRASEASWGSKNGKRFIQFHKPGHVKAYQEALREEFTDKYPNIKPTNQTVCLDFWFWRQMANVADATNLQKSTEDALQGLLIANDSQVKSISSFIMEQTPDTEPAILIRFGGTSPSRYLLGLEKKLQLTPEKPEPKSNFRHFDVEETF